MGRPEHWPKQPLRSQQQRIPKEATEPPSIVRPSYLSCSNFRLEWRLASYDASGQKEGRRSDPGRRALGDARRVEKKSPGEREDEVGKNVSGRKTMLPCRRGQAMMIGVLGSSRRESHMPRLMVEPTPTRACGLPVPGTTAPVTRVSSTPTRTPVTPTPNTKVRTYAYACAVPPQSLSYLNPPSPNREIGC